ncbi:DEAD/DEAH box helicase [Janthinobacterium sp. HLX7-2]|uniref:DEAD/DEAH box helicase n=1 Tax=Janthinobacterium sp. HLX7-2 TaxID=1259331 RepID=UPI003F2667E5
MFSEFQNRVASLEKEDADLFGYLKSANDLLSNPADESLGRELVIRALDKKKKFLGYAGLLKNLVRKAGLYPYLNSEFSNLTVEDEYLLSVYRSTHSEKFIFHSMQLKIFNLLMGGHNVVLSAPTSMGKSAIADSLLASGKYSRIVIVVPTIALIDETRRRVAEKFSSSYEIIYHSSQVARSFRKTIYILTQERVNERKDILDIDLFIIDEFYKLSFKRGSYDERAISLNIALSKLLVSSKQFFMIGPSIDDVTGLSSLGRNYFFLPSSFNTVALNIFKYDIDANSKDLKNSTLVKILQSRNNANQTLIYCKSPNAAAEIATLLISEGFSDNYDSEYVNWIKEKYSSNWSYSKAINAGIGIHHGALPRAIQQFTVDLFNSGVLKILICTSTIIEGVNTTAENVIIYDNRNGVGSIDRFTHNNIKGRAGRMNVHFVGNVHCLERIPEKKIENQVVEIPLGTQDENSPLNFIAGIEEVHIQPELKDSLEKYVASAQVPLWILKKHATFSIESLRAANDYVNFLSFFELRAVCSPKVSAEGLEIICGALKVAASAALRNLNLHGEKSDLKLKISKYLFAESHQSYLDEVIDWVLKNNESEFEKSVGIDRELKIIRNIFGFTVPSVLSLLQDLINYRSEIGNLKVIANFGFVTSKFEYNHLPKNFSALEEMGIPVQTLQKLVHEKLSSVNLNVLIRYIRWNFNEIKNIDNLDRAFIARALKY